MANKRDGITKKMRFEVFKRDSFRCQYCGRQAPDVILEVDHIHPVAEGGKTTMLNLITSCRDCNRGKGKHKLSDNAEILKQKEELNALNERRLQMEMIVQWKKELQDLLDREVELVESVLVTDPSYCLTENARRKVRTLIKQFGFNEVYEASEIATEQYTWLSERINKIGGICYNRKKGIHAWESKE